MGRHKNNAIILTTIVGERGTSGFQGPDGQPCYTGTGNPNTLNFSLPDYSADPTDIRGEGTLLQGLETLFYQDDVTGDIWAHTLLLKDNIFNNPITTALNNWFTIGTTVTGETGERGATSIDKVDVSFAGDNAISGYYTEVSDLEITKIMFPGTDQAPDFSEVTLIANVGQETEAHIVLKDSDLNIVAEGNIGGSSVQAQDIPVTGTFPTKLDVMTVHLTMSIPSGSFLTPYVGISFLSLR